MLRSHRCFLLAFCLGTCFGARGLGFDEKTAYELPDGAKSPVVELDFKGGFTPPRKKADPALSILADGTVLLPDRFGVSRDLEGRITQRELQELLRFVLDENDFDEIDGKAIKRLVQEQQRKRGGFAPVVADAPTTWIRVTLKGDSHEAEYYALGMAARQYPTVVPLQRFDAVGRRLQHVMNVVRGGGRERVTRMLALANAELKRQHPDAAPLEFEHLTSAFTGSDGTTRYAFGWNAQGMPGVPATNAYVNATIVVPENGEPRVTINAKP